MRTGAPVHKLTTALALLCGLGLGRDVNAVGTSSSWVRRWSPAVARRP